MTEPIPSLAEALTEIRRLRARVAELEVATAITLGTLEPPPAEEPARYTHSVRPNAPPHDERDHE